MLTDNDLSAIQKLLKTEIQGVEERLSAKIDALDMKVKVLNTKIYKVQESVGVVQNVTVEHYGKLEKRVATIKRQLTQYQQGLTLTNYFYKFSPHFNELTLFFKNWPV